MTVRTIKANKIRVLDYIVEDVIFHVSNGTVNFLKLLYGLRV